METLEQKIIREWKTSPELRAEFGGNITAYENYCRAVAAGMLKIIGKQA